MSKTWKLIRIMLKMQYSRAGKKNSETALLIVALLFLLPLAFVYISIVQNALTVFYEALEPLGQESLIIGILLIASHVILLFVSFISILNAFYFAEDIDSFIPFPLQPYQLLLAKSAGPLIYLYGAAGLFFLPVFFTYGTVSAAPFLYYIVGILLFLLLPLIPFAIAGTLLMFIMRFVNIAKNKERSKVIAGVASFIFIILINILVRLNADVDAIMQDAAMFIQEQDGLLQWITAFYPPAYFGTMALTAETVWNGVLSFFASIALHVAAVILFIWAGQLLYIKGVRGMNTANKSTFTGAKLAKNSSVTPVWLSYIRKELRIIFRTPTFLTQCVFMSLFAPIFLIVILFMDSSSGNIGGLLNELSGKHGLLLLFIGSLLIIGSNATSITGISREGKSWHANLFLPLNPKQILFSKVATAWIINLVTILLAVVLFIFVIKIDWTLFLVWLPLVLLSSWFSSALGTFLDFTQPKLNWTDEQEVFKSRMVGLIGLVIQLGIFGILVLLLWNLDFVEGILMTAFILFVLVATGIIVMHSIINKKIKQGQHQTI
ncbi:putative ABC transporter permease subunit [Oceanobacillus kapialis]|uniref:ABC transporter permease n=1 Tax=Oceanobacillus kapialis TaxID=481353 RepID=A0ABW5Q4B9_9BACI